MGNCKYCGQKAGFFHRKHAQCEQLHLGGVARIKGILAACFQNREDFYIHKQAIEDICRDSYISAAALSSIYCDSFDVAIESYLNDGIIDKPEERAVARYMQFTGLSQPALNANKSLEKVVQSQVLQDLFNGKIPKPKITVAGSFPFILGKDENMLWLFRGVTLRMQKVRRETVGQSNGMSMRVCSGVYYHTGGFRSRSEETTYMERIGVGSVCLTDKHLYFHYPEKTLKIPFSKIVALEPYSNGLGVQKGSDRDKPIFFENLNSWFCYNVISNLK